MNTIIKSIFILCLLLSLLFFAAYAAIPSIDDSSMLPAVTGHGELLANPGFEEDSGWTCYSGSSYSTDYAYEGNRSMKLSVTSDGYTHIAQGKSTLVEGAVYQISVRVYQPEAKGEFRIGNEYYGSGSSWLGHQNWIEELTPGSWTQVSATFSIPEGTTGTRLYFWLYTEGNEAYIDDASLVMIKEPDRVSVTTDQIYYYTNSDVTHGAVKLTPNTSAYPEYESWSVSLMLKKSNGAVLYSDKDIDITSGETVYVDYSLSYLDDADEDYTLSVIVFDSDGEIIEQSDTAVYRRFPRPSMIDSNGNFQVDGEEFVPVIGYWVYNQSDFYAQAKAMGINVIETSWGNMDDPDTVLAELDRLQDNGFMGIINMYYQTDTGWNEKYREDTKNLIDKIKNHPAVFAYCIMDEPIAKNIDLEELGQAYEYIRSVDTVHPVYACDMFVNYAELLSKYHDMVCFDKYPSSSAAAMDYVRNCYEEAEFYTNNQKKPKLSILRFYQDSSSGYFPTGEDMRNMLYQNYMLGAKGHGFYPIGWTNVTDSETGETVRNLDTEAADAVKGWSSKESAFFEDTFVFGKNTLISSGTNNSCQWMLYDALDEIYFVVRNTTTEQKSLTVSDDNFTSGVVLLDDYDSDIELSIYDGSSELTLPASAAVMYRLARDTSKVIVTQGDETTYSYSLYRYLGKLFVEITNKVSYASKVVGIENKYIKSDMLTEHISGDGAVIRELSEGYIEITVPKKTTVTYALTKDKGTMPVPYLDNTVVTALAGGKTINASVFPGLTTIIAFYDGNTLVAVVQSGNTEVVSFTLPDTITDNSFVKLMRWNELMPIAQSVRIPK